MSWNHKIPKEAREQAGDRAIVVVGILHPRGVRSEHVALLAESRADRLQELIATLMDEQYEESKTLSRHEGLRGKR